MRAIRNSMWWSLIAGMLFTAIGLYCVVFADNLNPFTVKGVMHRHGGISDETFYPRSTGWTFATLGIITLIVSFGFFQQSRMHKRNQTKSE